MNNGLPPEDLETPRFLSDLVQIPYQEDTYLCPQSQTRWKLEGNELFRDLEGERDWADMAGYVDQSYSDVFMESYRRALEAKQRG